MLVRMLFALALLAPPAHAGALCSLEAPPDARFEEVRLVAEGVHLVVEVWVGRDADIPWARSILDAMASSGHGAVVVVPYREDPSEAIVELVDSLADGPHEPALSLTRSQVPRDTLTRPGPMRRKVKAFERAGQVKVVFAPLGSRGPEAILGKVGFRALVDTDAAATAQPRLAGHLEGQPRINVVLPPGAYGKGRCGTDPRVAGFSPATADRTSRALLRSGVEAKTTPTVRLALHPGKETDGAVLRRWLDEVVLPAGVKVATASETRSQALVDFRRSPSKTERNRTIPGRLVTEDDLRKAAATLADLDTLPRELPGELNPTEAFLGFSLLLAEGSVDGTVRLRALSGPVNSVPGSSTGAVVEVEREALVKTSKQLLAALPPELPNGMPVGGQLLTIDRYLTALASAVRGDDPAKGRPIAHPDPHARGLGWGTSE